MLMLFVFVCVMIDDNCAATKIPLYIHRLLISSSSIIRTLFYSLALNLILF